MINIPGSITAHKWHATLSAPVITSGGGAGASLARYTGSAAAMVQPALSEHILCLHLGGAKRVLRSRGARTEQYDVGDRALTIMPANQVNRWLTQGPIDFAHLILDTPFLDRVALEEFGWAEGCWELPDTVGLADPAIEHLYLELLCASGRGKADGRLYPESLMAMLSALLVGRHAIAQRPTTEVHARRGGLAGWRLRRVIDYMAANLAEDVGLDALVQVAGLSRAQFFRAFRQSTGLSPHKYLAALRLDQAASLLCSGRSSAAEAAAAVGLKGGARFACAFEQRFGVRPQHYRDR